jgi:hypothetical protein
VRVLLTFAVTLMGIFSAAALAREPMKLEFTKGAQALFEKGNLASEMSKVTKKYKYIWTGSKFTIEYPYQPSVLNDTLTCYQLHLEQLSAGEGALVGVLSLTPGNIPPQFYCEADIDIEVVRK